MGDKNVNPSWPNCKYLRTGYAGGKNEYIVKLMKHPGCVEDFVCLHG